MSSSPPAKLSQFMLSQSTNIEHYVKKAQRLRSTYLLQIAQRVMFPMPTSPLKIYKPLYARHKLPFNTHLIAAMLR